MRIATDPTGNRPRPGQPSGRFPTIPNDPIPDDADAVLRMLNTLPKMPMVTKGPGWGAGHERAQQISNRMMQLVEKAKSLGMSVSKLKSGWEMKPMTEQEKSDYKNTNLIKEFQKNPNIANDPLFEGAKNYFLKYKHRFPGAASIEKALNELPTKPAASQSTEPTEPQTPPPNPNQAFFPTDSSQSNPQPSDPNTVTTGNNAPNTPAPPPARPGTGTNFTGSAKPGKPGAVADGKGGFSYPRGSSPLDKASSWKPGQDIMWGDMMIAPDHPKYNEYASRLKAGVPPPGGMPLPPKGTSDAVKSQIQDFRPSNMVFEQKLINGIPTFVPTKPVTRPNQGSGFPQINTDISFANNDPKRLIEMLASVPRTASQNRGPRPNPEVTRYNRQVTELRSKILSAISNLGFKAIDDESAPTGRKRFKLEPMSQDELNRRDQARQSALSQKTQTTPPTNPSQSFLPTTPAEPSDPNTVIVDDNTPNTQAPPTSRPGTGTNFTGSAKPGKPGAVADGKGGFSYPRGSSPLDKLDSLNQARDIHGNEIKTADMLTSGGVKLQQNQRAKKTKKDFGGLQFRNMGGKLQVVGRTPQPGATEAEPPSFMGQTQPPRPSTPKPAAKPAGMR